MLNLKNILEKKRTENLQVEQVNVKESSLGFAFSVLSFSFIDSFFLHSDLHLC